MNNTKDYLVYSKCGGGSYHVYPTLEEAVLAAKKRAVKYNCDFGVYGLEQLTKLPVPAVEMEMVSPAPAATPAA